MSIDIKNRTKIFITVFLCFLLSACVSTPTQQPNVDIVSTAAMETAFAQITQTAEISALEPSLTNTFTVTATEKSETSTPVLINQTETNYEDVTETITPIPMTLCNRFNLIGELSIADGSELLPGESFQKIWRLRNLGQCVWNGDYSLIFIDGDQMTTFQEIPFNTDVEPGEVFDLSVKLTAPGKPGRYWGKWILKDNHGNAFGPEEDPEGVLRVDITVVEITYTQYPQIKNGLWNGFCLADWTSNQGAALCSAPGNLYQNGGVYREMAPVLEGENQENEPSLVMIPGEGEAGWVSGTFPPFTVSSGDFFYAWVGCIEGNPLCDVTFELSYVNEDGTVVNLGTWQQKSDGEYEKAYVNLKSLVGQTIRLVLTVKNDGMSHEDVAFWLSPSIRH